jgi:ribosomal protein S18 acetylase RimI-like enzyme
LAYQIVDIRQLKPDQFTSMLKAEAKAWTESLRWDFTASARVISSCLRENRLYGEALVSDGEAHGYCFYFFDDDKGLVGDLFVMPGPEAREQVNWLLQKTLDTLLARPGLHRVEAQLPHYSYEQVDSSFRARCFSGYVRRFMALSLAGYDATVRDSLHGSPGAREWNLSNDFVIRPWERSFDPKASELLAKAYKNHVDSIINEQYTSQSGTARLIENIVSQQGCGDFLDYASFVAIHKSTRELAGILALTAVRKQTAHIPQVAVAPRFQGTGVGTALMRTSFAELARRGFEEVSLTVTDLNAGAVRLYERIGFETFRTFGGFVWTSP